MKKIILFLVLIASLAACKQNQNEASQDITVPVTVNEIKPGSIEQFTGITGNVKPVKEVQLKSEMSGQYQLRNNPGTGRPFSLGAQVKEGQEIISLEDKEYESNIKINSLKLNLETSKQVFEKQQSLYDKGGVTLSELKNAEINFMNANYSYEDALFRLQKMHVKAPFSGIIVDLPYFTPGVKTDVNAALVKIMDFSSLLMEINLPEKTMGYIKAGQEVRITNYTFPNDTLRGTISQLSPAIDPDTRSFKGVVLISNPKLLLRPGMYAKAEIIVSTAKNTIVIPKDIILSKQNGNTVFVVEKGVAYERIVQLGLENPTEVQIVSGLSLKDKIVTKGFETLRDRTKVKEMK